MASTIKTTIGNLGIIAVVNLTKPYTVIIPGPTEMNVTSGYKQLVVKDHAGRSGTHPITIESRNGTPIRGLSIIRVNFGAISLYTNGSIWTDSPEDFLSKPPD